MAYRLWLWKRLCCNGDGSLGLLPDLQRLTSAAFRTGKLSLGYAFQCFDSPDSLVDSKVRNVAIKINILSWNSSYFNCFNHFLS